MKFNCYFIQDLISARWPRRDKKVWRKFFAIRPRRIDNHCYILQTLERRRWFESGDQFLCGWNYWDYRLPVVPRVEVPATTYRRIAAAAIQGPWGIIYQVQPPGRHHHVIKQMIEGGFTPPITYPQGFVTDRGEFVDREVAKVIARIAGQIIRHSGGENNPELYTEDLW